MSLTIYGVDGRPKAPEPVKPERCIEPHCWHLDAEQHTVPNHSDWKCCNCGARHCVSTRMLMHGPHAGPLAEKGCGDVLGQVVLP